jgi:hypothetical protein
VTGAPMNTVGAHLAGAAGRSHPPWVLAGVSPFRAGVAPWRLRAGAGIDQLQCGVD